MDKIIEIKAPAKINLSLEIIERLPNGYHNLRTVMMKLPNLYDEVFLKVSEGKKGIVIKSNSFKIPRDERNVCFKAAKVFLKEIKKEVKLEIKIKKNIPVSGGLGGGSSDGAAVFLALNELFENPLPREKLINLAADVGKDIPFFFSEKETSLIEGMGEKIKESIDAPFKNILIVNPLIHVSTARAYRELSKIFWFMESKKRRNISSEFFSAIKTGDKNIFNLLYNDFEIVVQRRHPIIKELKQAMIAFGALGSLMSGAGPTVFGIFNTEENLKNTKKEIRKKFPKFVIEEA